MVGMVLLSLGLREAGSSDREYDVLPMELATLVVEDDNAVEEDVSS